MSALQIEILRYEDTFDHDYTAVTHYIITVTNTKSKHSYELRKRYSEFAQLYAILRERYPEVENFRFPKKSMFNTQANFTKDRRQQGFNEFMKLLIPLLPIPEVSAFLELDKYFFQDRKQSLSPDAQTSKNGIKSAINTKPRLQAPKLSARSFEMSELVENSKNDPSSSTVFFTRTLPTSFVAVAAIYAAAFYFNLLDVYSTSNGRIALTLVVLTFFLAASRKVFTNVVT